MRGGSELSLIAFQEPGNTLGWSGASVGARERAFPWAWAWPQLRLRGLEKGGTFSPGKWARPPAGVGGTQASCTRWRSELKRSIPHGSGAGIPGHRAPWETGAEGGAGRGLRPRFLERTGQAAALPGVGAAGTHSPRGGRRGGQPVGSSGLCHLGRSWGSGKFSEITVLWEVVEG